MNISYNWLRDLVDIDIAPRELAERLTMLGLAVDGVHEKGGDYLIDIDLTSNRPDCLSHLGVAREVAAMNRTQLRIPNQRPAKVSGDSKQFTSVEILDTQLCPRYAARVVCGVKIKPSPDWLIQRLEAIGQRPINNVADITNYVLHEMGQPLHAFDLAKLAGPRIVVRRANQSEKLRTLDGVERQLDDEMLVIADAERAVALAGVMGGEDTEISDETVDVLIESAYFLPKSVRRTARLLGMHTEASHRFERGVDFANVLRAQQRCVALICDIAGGTAAVEAIDVYPRHLSAKKVTLRPERVETLTGLSVSSAEIERILETLGFRECERVTSAEEEWTIRDGVIEMMPEQYHSKLTFLVPTWRFDVEIEEDLIEEVARHTGYDKIATDLPASSVAGEYQPNERRKIALCSALTSCGFDEAINLSFIDSTHDDTFELLPALANTLGGDNRFVALSNPIIEGVERMRPTLLAGLLNAVKHNFNHGTRNVRLFELGRVFAADSNKEVLPQERESLAIVGTGGATEENRADAPRELDFFDIKGALETAVDEMNLSHLLFEQATVQHLRAGQAAAIHLSDGRLIGYAGRLAEHIESEYKFRAPVFVAEIDLTDMLSAKEGEVLYTPLARYPSVGRDVSLLVARSVTYGDLIRAVEKQNAELCRGARLVGVYEGPNLPDDKRSITIRLEYRADDRTLRDEEVDELHNKIVINLEEKFAAMMRA